MRYDGDGSAESVLTFLDEEGYAGVLEYHEGKRYAYLEDEEDDDGRERISVAVVRKLIADGKIAIWRTMGEGWNTYRPTAWVNEWLAEYPKCMYCKVNPVDKPRLLHYCSLECAAKAAEHHQNVTGTMGSNVWCGACQRWYNGDVVGWDKKCPSGGHPTWRATIQATIIYERKHG